MPRFRLTLAYDGTDFAGSQAQPNQRTVQGVLEQALDRVLGEPPATTFAGRTDRGVHATGQVVAFDAWSWRSDARVLRRALNATLPADLRAIDASECDPAFHPRFDAAWREYRYWIAPGADSPFLGRYAWSPRANVDLDLMADGARNLVGTHDFASFAGGGEGVPWSERSQRMRGTTRTIYRCAPQVSEMFFGPGAGPETVVEVTVVADGFLPRMVRNIVGALVEVGQGRQEPSWIGEILGYRDRRMGSVVAPALGLTLSAVGYGDDPIDDWQPAMPGRCEAHEGAV
jgi:tRNA pseudouridine38-40 synthase